MNRTLRLLCASLLVLSACGSQASDVPAEGKAAAPHPAELQSTGWVTDAANILTDVEEERITKQLRQLEQKTGHQMVVVTVPTLEGQPIEEYSLRLFRRWGVGRRQHSDGVGVLLAPNERRVRVEVGSGLEQVVTNDFAAKVIQTEMIPRFKENAYGEGVSAGVATLVDQLSSR